MSSTVAAVPFLRRSRPAPGWPSETRDEPEASGKMVISTVALGGLEYYRRALQKIAEEGLLSSLQRTRTPNLAWAGSDVDPRSRTSTERLLRRWADRRSLAERQTTPQSEVPDEPTAADRG